MGINENAGEDPIPEVGICQLVANLLTKAPYKGNFKDVLNLAEILCAADYGSPM